MTASRTGAQQPLGSVLAQLITPSTTCCIPIVVQAASTSVVENLNVRNFLQLKVNTRPNVDVNIVLNVLDEERSPMNSAGLFPASFRVSSLAESYATYALSTSTTASSILVKVQTLNLVSALLPLPGGRYTYSVSISGSSASQYGVVYASADQEIQVVSAAEALPAPVLLSAVFADDGSYLAISFDSNTDRGGTATQFTCSVLLSFPCAVTSRCVWVSSKQVNAYVSRASSCARVGSTVSIISSATIKAQCQTSPCDTSQWLRASVATRLTVTAPLSATAPTVAVSAPNTIGECDNLVLDLSTSSGNGGRAWTSRNITVETSASVSVTGFQAFLNSEYQESPPTPVPATLLQKGAAYNFVVKLCNFLGKCSQGSKRVLVLQQTIPTVTLPGSALRTTQRSAALVLGSDAFAQACGRLPVRTGLSYAWAVSLDGAPLLGASSQSKDPSKLRLPAYALAVGKVYDVTLRVSTAGAAQSSSASVQVYVLPGSVVAVVAQGTSRTVQVQQNITIDGSASYDEDQQGVTGLSSGLHYSWSCVQVSPMYVQSCDGVFTGYGKGPVDSAYSGAVKATAAGSVVEITMYLLDNSLTRSAQTVVTVTVAQLLSPLVTVSSNAASAGIVNRNRELQLSGSVILPAGYNGTVTWSVDDSSNFDFIKAARSPLSAVVPMAAASPQKTLVYLVMAANTLPERATLVFSLRAELHAGVAQATSSIAVTVNAPPVAGVFTVSPRNGTEITQKFSFLASLWSDADLPLQYQFAYLTNSGSEATLQSKSEMAFGSAVLTAGLASRNFSVSCLLDAYDSLSAVSRATFLVTVHKRPALSAADLSALMVNTLAEGSANVDSLKQATTLGAYLLNNVDCSAAPDCASLKRAECFQTANMCGGCLSDAYIGDAGDSNTPCVSATRNYSMITGEGTCTSPQQCGAFQDCLGGRCVRVPKECPRNCSFPQGSCQHVDASSGVPVSDCFVGSTNCVAVCECEDAYLGSEDCSLSAAQLELRQGLRLQVVQSVKDLIAMEDADQLTVKGWIGSAVAAAQVPHELSEEGISALLSVASTVVASAGQVQMSVDETRSLLMVVNSAVDAYARGQRVRRRRMLTARSSNSTLLAAAEIISAYQQFVSDSVLPDQDPVQIVLPQFRVLVQKLSLLSSERTTVSTPQSALEVLNGDVPSSVMVPKGSVASGDALAVTLTTMRSELFNTELALTGQKQLFSNPLSVALANAPCDGDDCRFEITLQTASLMTGYAAQRSPVVLHNTTCVIGDKSRDDFTCPDGAALPVACNGTDSYVVLSRCPETSFAPACNAVSGGGVEATDCTLVARTATTVTCSCPLSSHGRQRRLQQGGSDATDDSVAPAEASVSYVAMLSEVQDNFVGTVISAKGLNASTIEKGWSALVTVGTLAAAILIAVYWSHQADADMDKIKPEGKKGVSVPSPQLAFVRKHLATVGHLFARVAGRNRVDTSEPSKQINHDVLVAEEALPAILGSNTLTNRVKDELKHHHKWFGIVFFFSRAFPRVLRVMSLATNVIIMLFIQSITYALTNPDDGTCESMKTEDACLGPSSPYATGESKCQWLAGSSHCVLVQPDSNVKVILFVAIFSALMCTPLALLVDWIILYVLSAPTKRVIAAPVTAIVTESGNVRSRHRSQPTECANATAIIPAAETRSADRKRSSLSRSIFGSVFGATAEGTELAQSVSLSAQSDLRKLVDALTAYRAQLNEQQRSEFDGEYRSCAFYVSYAGISNSSFLCFLYSNLGPG
jgi:hypothetical protein